MTLLSKFKIQEVEVVKLSEWQNNPRIHSEKGVEDLKNSIGRFGLAVFLYCDSDLTIVGGHARKKALIALGVKKVKCWVAQEKLSDEDFKAVALLSNRVYSAFNQEKLNDSVEANDLVEYGFEVDEVDFEVDETEFEEEATPAPKKHQYQFKFNSDEKRTTFEKALIRIGEEYDDIDSDSERFIQFLKDNL